MKVNDKTAEDYSRKGGGGGVGAMHKLLQQTVTPVKARVQ